MDHRRQTMSTMRGDSETSVSRNNQICSQVDITLVATVKANILVTNRTIYSEFKSFPRDASM